MKNYAVRSNGAVNDGNVQTEKKDGAERGKIMLPDEILCPDCGAALTLNETERRERKFACAGCHETFHVKDSSAEEAEHCPNCESIIPPGERACAACGWSEEMEVADSGNLVTVYIPMNEADHLTVGALLRGAGIDYHSQSAGVQDLFGAGQIGGFNLAAGPIKIQVAEENVEAANEIINHTFSRKDDRGEYEIPNICPACHSPTNGFSQCLECGLDFIPGGDEEQRAAAVPEAVSADTQTIVDSMVKKCMILCLFWFGGLGSIFAIYYGVKSLRLIRQANEEIKGKRKAIFGIIFGSIGVFLSALLWYSLL